MIDRKNDCDQAQKRLESSAYLSSVDAFIVFSFDAVKLLDIKLLLVFFRSVNVDTASMRSRRQFLCRRLLDLERATGLLNHSLFSIKFFCPGMQRNSQS